MSDVWILQKSVGETVMRISHVLYKVDNLEEGKKLFEKEGFFVEYGSKKNPHNAIIHFPDGSYVEIIQNMGFTKFLSWMLKRMGYGRFVEGMMRQQNGPQGYIRISFDNEDETFSTEKPIYEKNGLETVVVPVKRKDINGNILRCKCLFPYDERYPFIKSRFTGESTETVRHPNGAIGIDKIDYYVTQKEADFIKDLGGCGQLNIHIGEQPMKVHFLYEKN